MGAVRASIPVESCAAIVESTQHAAMGGKPGGLERRLVAIARHLSARLIELEGSERGSPGDMAHAFFRGSEGVGVYLRGDWRRALTLLDESTAGTEHYDHSAGWRADADVFASWSLNFLGEHRELARRHANHLASAEARGDRYTSTQLRDGSLAIVWLAQDDPEGARRNVNESMALWPRDRYLLQHWHRLYGEGEIELYVGDGARAYARIERDARALGRSLLLTVQHMRVQTAFLRGRAAIASLGAEAGPRTARLAEARRIARQLEKEDAVWSAPFASILRAAVADAEGDRAGAVGGLREAIARAMAADMNGYATAARYQLGCLLGGDEGHALVEDAERAMQAQGIRAPARFSATLVPGTWKQRG
jgi:hypothetical protein